MEPYTRSHSWRKATVRLPDRATAAAYGTWRRRVYAWERRERYRVGYMHLGEHTAAGELGVTTRTIERWRVIIWEGRHIHPGPWVGA